MFKIIYNIVAFLIIILIMILVSSFEVSFNYLNLIEKEASKETDENAQVKIQKFIENELSYKIVIDIVNIILIALFFNLTFKIFYFYNNILILFLGIILIVNIKIFTKMISKINIYRSFNTTIDYINGLYFIFYPITFLYRYMYDVTLKNEDTDNRNYTEEDIKFMLNSSINEDVEKEEKEMIHSIFNFSDTAVKEIMTPRTSIVALDKDSDLEDSIWEEIIESGFSRIPIYNKSIDDIIGVLNVKDLFKYRKENKGIKLESLCKKVSYVPESKLLMDMLEYFRKEQQHMAIIIDEYGGTLGLITIEDLLEEIVGEIRDEYDIEEESFKQISNNVYEILGDTLVEEINEKLGLNIELSEEYDTISGYIQDKLERVAKKNDKIIDENYIIQVLKIDNKRINKVKLIIKE